MKTNIAQMIRMLEKAKSEKEMLALAEKIGAGRAFFNVGSAVEVKKAARESPRRAVFAS